MSKAFKNALTIMLLGLLAAGVGTFFTVSGRKQAARDTEPAAATVIRYDEETEYNSATDIDETTYFLVVSYNVNGKTVESRYSQGTSDREYKAGDTVNIKYNPDDPEEFVIDGDNSIKNGAVWVIPVGAVIFLFGLGKLIVPVVASKKQSKAQPADKPVSDREDLQ